MIIGNNKGKFVKQPRFTRPVAGVVDLDVPRQINPDRTVWVGRSSLGRRRGQADGGATMVCYGGWPELVESEPRMHVFT